MIQRTKAVNLVSQRDNVRQLFRLNSPEPTVFTLQCLDYISHRKAKKTNMQCTLILN